MNIVKSCGLIATGVLAGMMLVISCSDDSPSSADAATCDCAPAEAPLAGRIEIVTAPQMIPPNSDLGQSIQCPDGALFLSGGCGTVDGSLPDILLRQSKPTMTGQGWSCWFRNNETTPVTIQASAVCLLPNS